MVHKFSMSKMTPPPVVSLETISDRDREISILAHSFFLSCPIRENEPGSVFLVPSLEFTNWGISHSSYLSSPSLSAPKLLRRFCIPSSGTQDPSSTRVHVCLLNGAPILHKTCLFIPRRNFDASSHIHISNNMSVKHIFPGCLGRPRTPPSSS